VKKVLLLGATGMLGHAVGKVLVKNYDLTCTSRVAAYLRALQFDAKRALDSEYMKAFFQQVGEVDYVINAIGDIRPTNYETAFIVNSVLPHVLARQYGHQLIHISTDCVYSGTDGKAPYNESSIAHPTDLYGMTKSLGEPKECLTIRTSIIGREMVGHVGLLEWFLNAAKSERAKQFGIAGYVDHFWNGITAHQYGLICDKIMERDVPIQGVRHVFSSDISKHDMLVAFSDRFNVKCQIIPAQTGGIDRRLGTTSGFNAWMKVPSFQEMLNQMPEEA